MADRELNRVTVNPKYQARVDYKSEFELYSDRFNRLFEQNYKLTDRLALAPKSNTPTVNLK